MDKKEIVKLEKKLGSVEKQLIGELFLTSNINDIIAFTQTYASNYIPVLFYAVKHFSTNQIAGLMNSSILIDRLLYGRINDVIRSQVHNDVKEFLQKNEIEDKSTIIRLIENQTILNKANMSSTLLFMFSFMRSAMFSFYCNKKLYLNYGIGWNNMLTHFVRNPHLIFMLDKEGIQKAEEQLDFIKKDIALVNGELSKEIKTVLIESNICNKKDFSKIKIHFVGLKIDWLKSKSLVEYCKYLKSNNKKNLTAAIKYSDLVLKTLNSEEYEYEKFSFRKKLTFPGPSPNMKKIIGDLNQYDKISMLYNYVAYFESENEKMVIAFPTNLEFYFNLEQKFKRENGISRILEDEEFILENHKKGCFSILDYLNILSEPNESEFYNSWLEIHNLFLSFKKDGLSNKFIYNQLKNSEIKDLIITKFENTVSKSRLISNALGLSFISGFNYFAEAKGLGKIPAYVNTTVPLITEIVIKTIYNSQYEKLILELTEEDDDNDILGFEDTDDYSSLQELEKQIESLEDTSQELVNYINMEGLKDILEMNGKIRGLLMSTKSIEDINKELQGMYESLEE